MSKIASVRVKQPHIEQLHKYLEQALAEIEEALRHKDFVGDNGWVERLGEAHYLVATAKQSLPPKQLTLDL